MEISAPLNGNRRQPAYQRIANGLRHEILSGKFLPGSLLPSTEEFAVTWESSYFTVHTALKSLVKEGWVERIHGQGTYVAQPEKRFLHAGIYHSLNIWSDEEAVFQRQLNNCLVEKFQALHKTAHIIIDSRPEEQQVGMFPELAQAIFDRRIQCIIAPNINSQGFPLLTNLSMPVALMTRRPKYASAEFDHPAFLRGGIQALAAQGCRSIGFVTNRAANDFENIVTPFFQEVENAGLKARPEWMIHPPEYCPHLAEFGYHSFRNLWKLPEKPDGLIVYPDMAVRGLIMAVLQCGTQVPEQMKFVFHRNAKTPLLCPFPVTWAITDENTVADALIQSVQRQFAGEKPEAVTIPYTFEYDDAKKWLA